MIRINRRDAMSVALGAVSLGLTSLSGPRKRPERVIVVALAGGIRTRETLSSPTNTPNLIRIANKGLVYSRARASNLGHFGATLSILTGISEARGIRENARGTDPTLFEYVRKDLHLAPGDAWVSTSGGAQEANVSHSLHPDYGPRYGATTVDGDGVFNADFKALLDEFGRPRDMEPSELALLARMRAAIGDSKEQETEAAMKVERFLLDELRRGTQDLKGLGAADAKAFRVARNLLAVFRPRLLTVVTRDADVAHGSFNDYVQVIRRNDAMLGELWDAVQEDENLRETTSFFILPEFGRDADLNSRRGLDHGDGSDDLRYVSIVCQGASIRSADIVRQEVSTIDVCSTVCDLMGCDARYSRGQRLPRLLG